MYLVTYIELAVISLCALKSQDGVCNSYVFLCKSKMVNLVIVHQ